MTTWVEFNLIDTCYFIVFLRFYMIKLKEMRIKGKRFACHNSLVTSH